jgi:hypothetical protein
MSDLKIVLYKDNLAPRSISLNHRILYRILIAGVCIGLLLILSLSLAVKFYLHGQANFAHSTATETMTIGSDLGPTNSSEDQNKLLKDQLDQLNAKLQNAAAVQAAPKEIDSKNPALALFAPIVSDKTKDQNSVMIREFRYSKVNGKSPATLTFELHNANAGNSTEKGYIVVLGKNETELLAYPNVFNKAGPYLLDFEKGETFQVARFRLVNAQFSADAKYFQVFIFKRNGELLVNTHYEVK